MPYKHNQLKDIKKTSQYNSKVKCSCRGLLLSRKSFRNKTLEKNIEKKKKKKQVQSVRSKVNILSFSR